MKTIGKLYGITRPGKFYQWSLLDTVLTIFTLGLWTYIKLEIDEAKWRKINPSSHDKLVKKYGNYYWRKW